MRRQRPESNINLKGIVETCRVKPESTGFVKKKLQSFEPMT
jgi:hypothetical protein